MTDSDMVTTRMRAITSVPRTRSGALLLLAAAAAAWSIIGLPAAKVVGLLGVASVCIALLMKFAHQHVVDQRLVDEAARRSTGIDRVESRLAELSDSLEELGARLAELSVGLGQADSMITHRSEQLAALRDDHARLSYRLADVAVVAERALLKTDDNIQLTRAGVRSLRIELDGLIRRIPGSNEGEPIDAEVNEPLLSIAIPAFNRPHELELCLDSIVKEVEATGSGRVEVWVTDDLSTNEEAVDIARRFAQRHSYIGFRQNAVNLGLERNLIKSCEPCTGEYIWIIGNDDIAHEGGMDTVLSDIGEGLHDVLLYDKVRIDHSGRHQLEPTPGCIPAGVESGERRSYETLLEFALQTGVLSGFGFISTLVIRRARYLAASADPYLGLTMYPQVGVLLESCGDAPLLFNHRPVVYHRTTTRQEKLAEALGRREEAFMAGGDERDPQWFGDTLAALFQRVIDRSTLTAQDFADIPEFLFGQESLVEYIERNRELGSKSGLELPEDVLADAERFIAALEVGGAD